MPVTPPIKGALASLKAINHIARRLGPETLARVTFLGGSALPLLLTDSRVSEIRPTNDVDVIAALTYSQYEAMAAELRANGFSEDTGDGTPICRWRVDRLALDLMPVDERIFGFFNRWYLAALQLWIASRQWHVWY